MTQLPPGQRKADGFPRFGGPFKPPTVPANPQQYGYLNAKHLCAIEIHTSAPPIPLDFVLFRQHSRARVWQEERNGVLPATVVRPIYRSLIRPFIWLSARGNWNLATKDR